MCQLLWLNWVNVWSQNRYFCSRDLNESDGFFRTLSETFFFSLIKLVLTVLICFTHVEFNFSGATEVEKFPILFNLLSVW